MSGNHERVTGEVIDIFVHRVVVLTPNGKILADLGPAGAQTVALQQGDRVELEGERKPSELKVHRVAKNGGATVDLKHEKAHRQEEFGQEFLQEPLGDVGDAIVVRTAHANGFEILGPPRRKPKHFEALGRDKAGDLVELHIELDGRLRKSKPVHADDPEWQENSSGPERRV